MVLGLQNFPMAYNILWANADDAEDLSQISALCDLVALITDAFP